MDTSKESILLQIRKQRDYYATGATKDLSVRIASLRKLKASILSHNREIENALWSDLHKSGYEAYLTEISIVLHELDLYIRKLKKWSRTRTVGTPIFLWPSHSRIVSEPYGHVLIVAPWNYPFQLLMAPLVAAVSAGNTVAVKPSRKTPETSEIMAKIIREVFDEGHVSCFYGQPDMNDRILAQRFDYIFFTGSPRVGRLVMEAASAHLTPVTLELGGKSPCIVDETANPDMAARRIIWGKLINAGQTCIAPDYLLVHQSVKKELLERMAGYIRKFYGNDPEQSPDYPRIISPEAVDRLAGLVKDEQIYLGGISDRDSRYFSPTILDHVSPDSAIMQEEIFGPVLPVISVNSMDEAIQYIRNREKPLALYFFGNRSKGKQVIRQTSSGGACINDTLLHIANPNLPFGGVGQSGMGSYHGRNGFETFTHRRSVLVSKNRIDFRIKYPPFRNLPLLKKLM